MQNYYIWICKIITFEYADDGIFCQYNVMLIEIYLIPNIKKSTVIRKMKLKENNLNI